MTRNYTPRNRSKLLPVDLVMAADLLAATCERFEVSPDLVRSSRRPPAAVAARWTVGLALRDVHKWRIKSVASFLNQREHTTSIALTRTRKLKCN